MSGLTWHVRTNPSSQKMPIGQSSQQDLFVNEKIWFKLYIGKSQTLTLLICYLFTTHQTLPSPFHILATSEHQTLQQRHHSHREGIFSSHPFVDDDHHDCDIHFMRR